MQSGVLLPPAGPRLSRHARFGSQDAANRIHPLRGWHSNLYFDVAKSHIRLAHNKKRSGRAAMCSKGRPTPLLSRALSEPPACLVLCPCGGQTTRACQPSPPEGGKSCSARPGAAPIDILFDCVRSIEHLFYSVKRRIYAAATRTRPPIHFELEAAPLVSSESCRAYFLSCFTISRVNAGRSMGQRDVTRFPSTTTSLSS